MLYPAGASPTFPLHNDEHDLGQLLDLAQARTFDFRADEERPPGSTLEDIPASRLTDLGGGARDAMRVFQERRGQYPTRFIDGRTSVGRLPETVAESTGVFEELSAAPAFPRPERKGKKVKGNRPPTLPTLPSFPFYPLFF